MLLVRNIFLVLVALLHFYILILEMFFWTKPKGLKTFGMNLQQAESQKILAANQGLYNGFLAAGLLWAALHPQPEFSQQLAYFFTTCVIIAALYGAFSARRKILFIQGTPGLIALIATCLNSYK